jgi:hypothetical protein
MILVMGGGLGAIMGTIDCLRRIGRIPGNFAVFTFATVVLAVGLGRGAFPFWGAVAVMMAHAGDYAGRVIASHLLRQPHPRPDWIAPVALAVAVLAGWDRQPWFVGGLLGWLGVRTAWGIIGALRPLSRDWRWVLPTPQR